MNSFGRKQISRQKPDLQVFYDCVLKIIIAEQLMASTWVSLIPRDNEFKLNWSFILAMMIFSLKRIIIQ